ncbi:MBL fold metallo-hydrolase [archaeon]|nr:MBL fold metallo-hydrolase [archaeon]
MVFQKTLKERRNSDSFMEVADKISLFKGECNTYYIDDKVKLLVDAGFDYQGKVDVILLTHGHEDHIKYLGAVMSRNPECQVFISLKEVELLNKNGVEVGKQFKGLYEGKTVIDTGKYKLEVIEVPAHTRGSVAFWDGGNKILFSGDTIFKDGIGRTDFPESVPDFMENAVTLLLGLDFELVLPGHGKHFKPEDIEEDKLTT